MYTLRTVYKEGNGWQEAGVEHNAMLGTCYTYIGKDRTPLQFQDELKRNQWPQDDKIYGLVRDPFGEFHPLYNWADHFIMTESGKTFTRI